MTRKKIQKTSSSEKQKALSLKIQKSCLDLACANSLAGCLKDAPEDLSTNKDYFIGYGGLNSEYGLIDCITQRSRLLE